MMEHSELVERGRKWLKNTHHCGVVLTEYRCDGSCEEPDVIGFKSNCSYLLECKSTRSDFLADKRKYFRRYGDGIGVGLGNYRAYLVGPGVVRSDDLLLFGWSVYEVRGKRVYHFSGPKIGDIGQKPNYDWERGILYSVARRIQQGIHVEGVSLHDH